MEAARGWSRFTLSSAISVVIFVLARDRRAVSRLPPSSIPFTEEPEVIDITRQCWNRSSSIR
jgi:hypothetical protein